MNNCDYIKIHKFVQNIDNFILIGKLPYQLNQHIHKVTASNSECNNYLINSDDLNEVLQAMNGLNANCNIMICDTSKLNGGNALFGFLDANANKFSYSRQMLVNAVREKCLFVMHGLKSNCLNRNNEPASIFLVLRTGGGVYDSRYVNATAKNIRKYITGNYEIVCLTDDASGITEVDRIVKMKHNYPKWWGKVELFREDISDRKYRLFLDLDTVLIDDASFLLHLNDGFYGIRDLYNLDVLQTGIMKWEHNEEYHKIYTQFQSVDISKYMNKGDHEWIGSLVKNPKFIQDQFPGEISSYKKHLSHITKKFMSPSVVCFHGDPRPHTVKQPFITDVWNY